MQIQPILLAGGASTRMSSPKQLLSLKQSTLIRLTAEKLIPCSTLPVICITGFLHTALQQALTGLPIQFIRNQNFSQGIHTSIQTAMHHIITEIESDAVLIALTDQPLIPNEHYLALTRAASSNPDQEIIATQYNGIAGVPALFKRSHFSDLVDLQSNSGAKQLIANNLENTILITCEMAGFDIDTDADYQLLLKRLDERF